VPVNQTDRRSEEISQPAEEDAEAAWQRAGIFAWARLPGLAASILDRRQMQSIAASSHAAAERFSASSCVTERESARAIAVADALTSSVAAIVGVNVAIAVATSVVSSTTVTASTSMASGASGGGATALIFQVQGLSMLGRLQTTSVPADPSKRAVVADFSASFEWANLDFKLSQRFGWGNRTVAELGTQSSRRNKASSQASNKNRPLPGDETDDTVNATSDGASVAARCAARGDCSLACHWTLLERVITFAVTLLMVSIARILLRSCVTLLIPGKTDLTELNFPMAEGPVFLVEFLGICDVLTTTFASSCNTWLAVGSALFIMGPGLFLLLLFVRLRTLKRQGALTFAENPRSSWRATWRKITSKGYLWLPVLLMDHINEVRSRGSWAAEGSGRLWLWVLADFTGSAWFYPALQLLRKMYLTTVLAIAGNGQVVESSWCVECRRWWREAGEGRSASIQHSPAGVYGGGVNLEGDLGVHRNMVAR